MDFFDALTESQTLLMTFGLIWAPLGFLLSLMDWMLIELTASSINACVEASFAATEEFNNVSLQSRADSVCQGTRALGDYLNN